MLPEGISVRVVNVPSEGLFRDQPKSYQEGILPAGVVRYGLTSGLPVNLMGLMGEKGMIHGLDHFGWSALSTVLDEKFGYNGATASGGRGQEIARQIIVRVPCAVECGSRINT